MAQGLKRFRGLRAVCGLVVAAVASVSGAAAGGPTASEIERGQRSGRVLALALAAEGGIAVASAGSVAAEEATVAAAEAAAGVTLARRYANAGGIRLLEFDAAREPAEVAAELMATGRYAFVEPDRILHASRVPNDPLFADGRLWGLNNTGQQSGVPDADVDAPEGWDVQTSAASVIVAVLDSGARLTHEDLAANLWRNSREVAGNGVDDDGNGYVDDVHGIDALTGRGLTGDDNGHGTHVAGTVGAVGDNGRGVAGVAWRVQLMPLRFLGASGSGSTADAIECVDYAIARGAHVINASYGSENSSQAELQALRRARDAGIIVVAAAGNDALNLDEAVSYPASYDLENILAVAAITRLDDVAGYSNVGSGAVEVAAPGTDVWSTYKDSDSDYRALSGTSMAAPHVAGVVAQVRARFPGEVYRQTMNRVLRGVEKPRALAGVVQTSGRVNLAAALATTSSAPFNDGFAERARVEGANLKARSSTTHATVEAGEPLVAGVAASRTLWWEWVAPASGSVTLDTAPSSGDTVLGVFTGSALGALTAVASNDDTGSLLTSRLTFAAVEGTAYQIVLGLKTGTPGYARLNLTSVPANDAFARARVVQGASWRVAATNAQATREAGEPLVQGFPAAGRTLWWKWTVPSTRRYVLNAWGSSVDTVVAVYRGTALGNLQSAGSNRQAYAGVQGSAVAFDAVAGETLYFVSASIGEGGAFVLSLIDAEWVVGNGDSVTSSPAVGPEGNVYYGANDGNLVAVSASGGVLWRYATGGTLDGAGPSVAPDGTVFVAGNAGRAWAINPSGTLRWTVTLPGSSGAPVALGTDRVLVRTTPTGGTTTTNRLLALSLSTGATLWSAPTGDESYGGATIGADGTVYVGTSTGRLLALTPSGAVQWQVELKATDETTAGGVYTTPALAEDGTVYAGTISGRMFAVSPSGEVQWVFAAGGGISSSPAVGRDGTVYFGSYDRNLYAVGADGSLRWGYETGGEIRAASPVVAADGTVYLGSYDGRMHAVTAAGVQRRTWSVGDWIRSSPVLANGVLYFGSNDRKFYAVRLGVEAEAGPWPQHRRDARRTGRWQGVGEPVVAAAGARLVSLATRVRVGGQATPTAIAGFVAAGPAGAEQPLLLRAVGPSLASRGVAQPLADPQLTLFAGATPFATNAGWLMDPAADVAATTAAAVGAAALDAAGGDAAVARTVRSGVYTMHVSSEGGGTGVVLLEAFDGEVAPTAGGPRLANLSTRAWAGLGEDVLIGGFVLADGGSRRLLVRAVGPGLASFSVPGPLAKPELLVYSGQNVLHHNAGWKTAVNAEEIRAVGAEVGAFALDESGGDAAVLLPFTAGAYTAIVRGADGGVGECLLEVYLVP